MTSRFFMGGSSDEVSSDTDSDTPLNNTNIKTANKFTFDDFDDEDAKTKRVVLSKSKKKNEALITGSQKLNTLMRNNDFNQLKEEFETFVKTGESSSEELPKIFYKAIRDITDFINDFTTEKSLKGPNQKAFKTLKQRTKKVSKQYEKEFQDLDNKPSEEEEEEEEEENSDDSSDQKPDFKKKSKFKKSKEEKEESSDFEFEKSEGDSDLENEISDEDEPKWDTDSSSSEEEAFEQKGLKGREKWLKKVPEVKEAKIKTEKKKNIQTQKKESDDEKDEKKEEEILEMNSEQIKEKLTLSQKERGKVHYDPHKHIKLYNILLKFAETPTLQAEVLIQTVTAHFDAFEKLSSTSAQISIWKSCFSKIENLLDLIEKNNLIVEEGSLSTSVSSSTSSLAQIPENEKEEVKAVQANFINFLSRLDQQYRISLYSLDPHLPEFVTRLQDEHLLANLTERILNEFQKKKELEKSANTALIKLQYIYYKPENVSDNKSANEMERLTTIVYLHGDSKMKSQALLYHIYYYALHGRYYQARDLMLMTRLQDHIPNSNHTTTMILFNRAMSQLGLCAFRLGLIKESHNCLNELYSSKTPVKELLSQQIVRINKLKADKEDYAKLVPFHMHINLELLESVYLTCALLLEVSNIAANPYESSFKKVISKPFRNYLKKYEQNLFSGPPENIREYIVAAARALLKGDWKKTEQLIFGLPMWTLIAPEQVKGIKAQISKKIQEEGLRTYLFTYGVYYESISLNQLSQLFGLSKQEIHSIVSRMLSTEELSGSWNQPSECLLLNSSENPRFNFLTHQLLEKATNLLENNEYFLQNHFGISTNPRDSLKSGHFGTSRKLGSSKPTSSKTNKQPNWSSNSRKSSNSSANSKQYYKKKW